MLTEQELLLRLRALAQGQWEPIHHSNNFLACLAQSVAFGLILEGSMVQRSASIVKLLLPNSTWLPVSNRHLLFLNMSDDAVYLETRSRHSRRDSRYLFETVRCLD